MHVFDWIKSKLSEDKEAKEWLWEFTQPKTIQNEEWLDSRRVTVEWNGERYICSGASPFGDVWLKNKTSKNLYDYSVNVNELSNWEVTMVKKATIQRVREVRKTEDGFIASCLDKQIKTKNQYKNGDYVILIGENILPIKKIFDLCNDLNLEFEIGEDVTDFFVDEKCNYIV